jgi:hypothetical protein
MQDRCAACGHRQPRDASPAIHIAGMSNSHSFVSLAHDTNFIWHCTGSCGHRTECTAFRYGLVTSYMPVLCPLYANQDAGNNSRWHALVYLAQPLWAVNMAQRTYQAPRDIWSDAAFIAVFMFNMARPTLSQACHLARIPFTIWPQDKYLH